MKKRDAASDDALCLFIFPSHLPYLAVLPALPSANENLDRLSLLLTLVLSSCRQVHQLLSARPNAFILDSSHLSSYPIYNR